MCARFLADLGAEVIKVEIPGRGDDTRAYPPFINGESSYFMSINRGKKSVTLNLKSEEAQEAFHRIADKCDVILENYRPGVTTRLGVDYETLKKVNPRLIYCSISSFGQTGPYSQWPGYDLIIQGMGGLCGYLTLPAIQAILNRFDGRLRVESRLVRKSAEEFCLERISHRPEKSKMF